MAVTHEGGKTVGCVLLHICKIVGSICSLSIMAV